MNFYLDYNELSSYENFTLALRDLCRKHFNGSAPASDQLRHVTTVGTPKENGDISWEDKLRVWQMICCLLTAGTPVSPDFTLDHTDLIQGRDFLAEETQTDLVLVCYLADFAQKTSQLPEGVEEIWLKEMQDVKDGKRDRSRIPGSRNNSALNRKTTSWYDRCKAGDVKIIMNDFGGLDIERFRGNGYRLTLNENNGVRVFSDTTIANIHREFQMCLNEEYAERIMPDLNAFSPLAQDIHKGLQRLKP